MLKNIRNKKAQNTAEYAILIALVIGGVVAMQTYAQRALQARVRDTSRYMSSTMGNALDSSSNNYQTGQYEAYYQNSQEITDKTATDSAFKIGNDVKANSAVLSNKKKSMDQTDYVGPTGE